MVVSDIILGCCLLFAGRKLFWLSVCVLGFIVGMNYAPMMMPTADLLLVFVVAIFFGILGAALAATFEWVAILLIGFLGGGYFVTNVTALFNVDPQLISWLAIAGGVAGVLVMAITFDVALIIISSLVGAVLIAKQFGMNELVWGLSFLILFVLGITVQSLSLGDRKPVRRHIAMQKI